MAAAAVGVMAEPVPAAAPANPTPYLLAARMPIEGEGGLYRRQAGYQHTATACSVGLTCAEACGPGSVTCDSSGNPAPEFDLYCYNPGAGDTCCSDHTGCK